MKYRRLFLFYAFFLGFVSSALLLSAERDSLWQEFQKETNPERVLKSGVNILKTIDTHQDSLIPVLHESTFNKLAEIKFNPISFTQLCEYISLLTNIGAYDEAEKTIDWSLQEINSSNIENFKSRLYRQRAILFDYKGKRKEVFSIYDLALNEMSQPNHSLMVKIKTEVGRLHYDLGAYNQAMENYLEALEILEKEGKKDDSYANLMHFIGSVFKRQNQDAKAMEYYEEMLKVAEQNKNLSQQGEALYLLADLYAYAGDYVTDKKYLRRSLAIYKKLDDNMGTALIQLNIAHSEIYEEQYDSVLIRLQEVEELSKKANSNTFDFTVQRYYGKTYARLEEYEKSMFHFEKALDIIRTSEVKQIIHYSDIYRNLAFINYDRGNFKKAFDYLDLHLIYKDSLINKENQKIIRDLEQKYENKKNEAEIIALNKDKLINAKELDRKNTLINAYIGGIALVLLLASTIFYSLLQNKKKNKIITDQKHEVEVRNQEIMDSITYAKRIQNAILPPRKLVKEYLSSSFILYKPKDIVAGDFYWMEPIDKGVIFAAADCTGHGVPGAMVSVICNSGLNRSVREFGLTEPGKILDKTRELVIQEFEKSDEDVKDGMDISLVSLTQDLDALSNEEKESHTLLWAGANNPLWIIREGENKIEEIKGDKQAIGVTDKAKPFTTHRLNLKTGDRLYLFTDGYVDQFGGENDKKFKSGNLKELLLSLKEMDMDHQKKVIEETFEMWKGDFEQIDDICMIGLIV